jgi:hypothetical protein
MSDILEDQRIHLIVKDYKRMAEQHDKLVNIGKEFQKQLIAKNKELAKVKEELNSLKAKAVPQKTPINAIKGQLGEIEARSISLYNTADKMMTTLQGIINNVNVIKQLIKENQS